MKDWIIGLCMVVGVFGSVGAIGFVVYRVTDPGPPATQIYQEGEMVTSVLTGQEGQVIQLYCYAQKNCSYMVRFGGDEYSTNTSFLGGTRPITHSPMSAVVLREYEIK